MIRTRAPVRVVGDASPRDSGVARQAPPARAPSRRGDPARTRGRRIEQCARRTSPSDVATTADPGATQGILGGGAQHPLQVRKVPLDVLTVRPEQACGLDDRVEDPDLEPLPDQELGELDVRALAKIVGLRLEAQPEQRNDHARRVSRILRAARRRCDSLLRMTPLSIGRSTSAIRAMCMSARKSLGRHEPPNEKPGPQVRGRDVETIVLAEHAHHLARVHVDRREQPPISFANVIFTRVIRVAGVLERFGRLD